MNRVGSSGSSVIVERKVGVNVGRGVLVASGAPVPAVVVGSDVLITNRSSVWVGCSENGVAVACGGGGGVGVCRNGMEIGGSPLQPARREINSKINNDFFITPLRYMTVACLRLPLRLPIRLGVVRDLPDVRSIGAHDKYISLIVIS